MLQPGLSGVAGTSGQTRHCQPFCVLDSFDKAAVRLPMTRSRNAAVESRPLRMLIDDDLRADDRRVAHGYGNNS
jgi:hypothetical protein